MGQCQQSRCADLCSHNGPVVIRNWSGGFALRRNRRSNREEARRDVYADRSALVCGAAAVLAHGRPSSFRRLKRPPRRVPPAILDAAYLFGRNCTAVPLSEQAHRPPMHPHTSDPAPGVESGSYVIGGASRSAEDSRTIIAPMRSPSTGRRHWSMHWPASFSEQVVHVLPIMA